MTLLPSDGLRAERERIVREHVEAERRADWGAALATFHAPRYEIMATGEVHQGPAEVAAFYAESARGLSGMEFETRALFHAGDALIHELVFSARHAGRWRGLPATGRFVRYPMLNVFVFDEQHLICERMYFDLLTPLRQLGIARDPTSVRGRIAIALNHPLVVAGAVWNELRGDRASPP